MPSHNGTLAPVRNNDELDQTKDHMEPTRGQQEDDKGTTRSEPRTTGLDQNHIEPTRGRVEAQKGRTRSQPKFKHALKVTPYWLVKISIDRWRS